MPRPFLLFQRINCIHQKKRMRFFAKMIEKTMIYATIEKNGREGEDMRILELPREKYDGYELTFSYTSNAYYDLKLRASENMFFAELVKTPCAPIRKEFSDPLFAPYWDDPHVFGLWNDDKMYGIMEVSPEKWNNRLRVTNLLVMEGYRRRGYGSLLLTKAKEIARAQGRRALILETQSCNSGAIAFYLSQGLTLMGFNSCEYSNNDIEKHEFRVEMGCLL